MRVLITGACGFTARYLRMLLAADDRIEFFLTDIDSGGNQNILECDLTVPGKVESLIGKVQPQRIYHLAGSFSNDYHIDYSTNVLSSKNIFDSLLKLKISARSLLIGSAAEYGLIESGDSPVSENHELRPVRVYGLTKVFQSCLMDFYHRVYGMDIVMARTFNLFGDGSQISRRLFLGEIGQQIERLKKGEISAIAVGNLESKRDYIDIEDAVQLYQKIMENGKAGEAYNVGSGKCVEMRDLLARLLNESGLDMSVVQEKTLAYPDKTDISEIYADLCKIRGL
jgi:GDP-4-dehydro-6-deoxy-D-mannose reductase